MALDPVPPTGESARSAKYPLYHMVVDGKDEWLSLGRAGAAYDNGFQPISFGGFVIDAAGKKPRPMTDDDRARIADMADEISDSK